MVDVPHAIDTLVTLAFPAETSFKAGDAVTVTGPSRRSTFSHRIERGTVVNVVDLSAVLNQPGVALNANEERAE